MSELQKCQAQARVEFSRADIKRVVGCVGSFTALVHNMFTFVLFLFIFYFFVYKIRLSSYHFLILEVKVVFAHDI
jgi:hypothetical protein